MDARRLTTLSTPEFDASMNTFTCFEWIGLLSLVPDSLSTYCDEDLECASVLQLHVGNQCFQHDVTCSSNVHAHPDFHRTVLDISDSLGIFVEKTVREGRGGKESVFKDQE